MKKILSIGMLTLTLNAMPTNTTLSNQDNSSKTEKKRYVIDLDKELKEGKERGGISDIIKGIIPLGHNDEVTFLGKKVLISKGIKVYINDIYQETLKVIKRTLTIKTDNLSVGDVVTIKTKRDKVLVEKKVTK